MSLVEKVRSIFLRKADDSANTSLLIRPPIPVFPNDGEDPLVFHPIIDTHEKKVIYALAARGKQPYEYLCMETKISPHELDVTLASLVASNRVKKSLLGGGDETDPWVFTMYNLA